MFMTFSLSEAPAVFQDLTNDVLCDFLNHFVLIYIDNILIFLKTVVKHLACGKS